MSDATALGEQKQQMAGWLMADQDSEQPAHCPGSPRRRSQPPPPADLVKRRARPRVPKRVNGERCGREGVWNIQVNIVQR